MDDSTQRHVAFVGAFVNIFVYTFVNIFCEHFRGRVRGSDLAFACSVSL